MNDKPKPKTQWDEALVIARNLCEPTDPDPAFVCECMNAITLERIAGELTNIRTHLKGIDHQWHRKPTLQAELLKLVDQVKQVDETLTQANWNLDRLVERTS